ncbi:MAG: hypothetical protein NTY06_00680 [Candidatus Gottesmanbacteria bacterium]|nr:hypothetical protein [Candidatus Gottesmanbacteria bacterium]
MTSPETFKPEMVEAYKSSIMKRYQLALAKPKGANCHDAAYYLLGVEPQEYGLDGVCYVDFDIFEQTDDINTALLAAFGVVEKDELIAVHVATLHPYDKTKVIHRDLEGYYQTRRSHHDIFTEIADTIEQLTVGGNPMRIEELEQVQKRWCGSDYFHMYLFTFKPEYFEEMLSFS